MARLFDKAEYEHFAQERMESFAERCRSQGLPVTPQRIAIIETLLNSTEHPRAEDIYRCVREKHPSISLTTVHRTLEVFCAVGEVRKVTPLHQAARYDANIQPHHHLVCGDCQDIIDIHAPEFDGVIVENLLPNGFEVSNISVEIHGRCGNCRLSGPHPENTL